MTSNQYSLDDGPGTPTPNRNHVPSTYAAEIPLPPSPTNFIQTGQNFWSQQNPTLDQSWEKLMKEVNRYDDDMVKNWKDEIDTLLVYFVPVKLIVQYWSGLSH
ncbi:hypothetical protein MPER_05169 [Moniliophthora perniciosa FA553]|nr:hypothetical protein MPER_05169 [Moniliophthora perniciosa FA553]